MLTYSTADDDNDEKSARCSFSLSEILFGIWVICFCCLGGNGGEGEKNGGEGERETESTLGIHNTEKGCGL